MRVFPFGPNDTVFNALPIFHSLGLTAGTLVALVSGACGAFLAVRVFAVATLSDWEWMPWAFAAVVLGLVAFFLFRSKR
jgi:acyl-CoA synthetase (AMP-forming)/AMP-acid ligase II